MTMQPSVDPRNAAALVVALGDLIASGDADLTDIETLELVAVIEGLQKTVDARSSPAGPTLTK